MQSLFSVAIQPKIRDSVTWEIGKVDIGVQFSNTAILSIAQEGETQLSVLPLTSEKNETQKLSTFLMLIQLNQWRSQPRNSMLISKLHYFYNSMVPNICMVFNNLQYV